MRDDVLGRRSAPFRLVVGRVRVADQQRVVTSNERAVQGGANARVGLGTDDDEAADSELRQRRFERRVLERVAVIFLDQRLGFGRVELGGDPPAVAAAHELLV